MTPRPKRVTVYYFYTRNKITYKAWAAGFHACTSLHALKHYVSSCCLFMKRKPMIKVSGTPPCVVGSNLKTESKCFVFASIPSKTLHLEKNYENRKSDWKLFPELPQRSTTSLKHGSDGSALPPIKSRVSDNSQLSQITQFSNWYVQLRISPHSGNLHNQTLIKTRVDSNKLITLLSWPILTNLMFVFVSCLIGQSVKRSLLDW